MDELQLAQELLTDARNRMEYLKAELHEARIEFTEALVAVAVLKAEAEANGDCAYCGEPHRWSEREQCAKYDGQMRLA